MKVVVASDSFKGSLTSAEIAGLVKQAAADVSADITVTAVPMADGGEGTVDAVLAFSDAEEVHAEVHGPLMDNVDAKYALFSDGRALVEMASASGLTLVPEDKRDPPEATSFGTGELIRDALDRGAADITVAIGGSATNDGGTGCLRALGAGFYDADGSALDGCGRDLIRISSIDMSGLDKRLADCRLSVMCDVKNPLTGPDGATYVYGAQKGADAASLEMLEEGMRSYRDVIRDMTGIDCDSVPGAGAAGGMGAALYALLGAELRPGAEAMLDLCGFDMLAEGADLIITGEGRADSQSLQGKVMQGVGRRAKALSVPAAGICGCLGDGWEGLLGCGISRIISLAGSGVSKEESMARAGELYYEAAVRLLREVHG